MLKQRHVFQGEVLAGLLLSSLGIFILFQALSMEYAGDVGPGAGFLPFWLGVIITGLSTLLVFVAIRKAVARRTIEPGWSGHPSRSFVSWLAMMVFAALLTPLGFYTSFAILTGFLVLGMESRSASFTLAVIVGSTLGFYLVFSLALRVPLPAGPWGF